MTTLEIVSFGKYKGKPVSELLTDVKYLEWCKLQDWFKKTNIYKIINKKQIINKYNIGDLEFKTKKECENYTRNIINTLGCCEIKKDNKYYIFFYNLVKNHPESELKIGDGIDYFYIMQNPLVNKYFQTMIKRIDGSEIDFSWVYCCKFKVRTNEYELTRAMRSAIKDDIIKFKHNQFKLVCSFCKIDNINEEYHVDHDMPSFHELKEIFLNNTTLTIPSSFTDDPIYKFTIFKNEDDIFKNAWIDYHNNNCNLQILCKKCNLTKK